jgi:MFS transporter, UMF1 family
MVITHVVAPRKRAPRKEIVGWAMFDFANQAYTLLIITVVFGDLFTRVIVGDLDDDYRLGNLLWSVALAVSYLLVVLTGPLLGAIMDYTASKKRFLFASYVMTVLTTTMLYLVAPGYILLGMLLLVASNYAYAIGEAFIASFLPSLGPPEDQGKISGFGWALGYIGGLLAAGFTLLFLGEVSAENFDRIRWVGPFAGMFFLLAAIPTFLWVREPGLPRRLATGESYFAVGIDRLHQTIRDLSAFRDLSLLMVSVFFTMAGIYIIITFSFIYGAQVIGWETHVRNIMFIVVQISAAVGAIGFGVIQDRIGAKPTYVASLLLWIVAITCIFATPQLTAWANRTFEVMLEAQYVFLVVGSVAGASLGSSQSAGRALVGIFAPQSKAAEFFGFWGMSSKLAAVLGILGLGLLQGLIGLHASILFCRLLFALAVLACLPLNQSRGRRAAEEWEAQEGGA